MANDVDERAATAHTPKTVEDAEDADGTPAKSARGAPGQAQTRARKSPCQEAASGAAGDPPAVEAGHGRLIRIESRLRIPESRYER